jgi:uncharacterized MAPEG superfamily protein
VEQFAQYGYAIASVAVYAVIAQILSMATGIRKDSVGLAPGAPHAPDYGDPSYRLDRTFMSTMEMLGIYTVIVFAAILAGADPFWINLLASAGMLLRVVSNSVYMRGIGKPYGGLRTYLVSVASVINLAMAVLAIAAVYRVE